MQFQAQAFEKFHNLPFDKPQKPPVMVTNNKIIHVPQIMAALQFFFNEMVQPVEVDVGKKLAGQVADRDSY